MEEILRRVLERVRPTEEERKRIERVMERVRRTLEGMKGEFSYEGVVFAGSSARDTNLRGSSDVDAFILYPKGVPLERIEEEVKRLSERLGGELRYAQHPYVRLEVDGVDVEVVPAYRMRPGERVVSATDRTPLHNEYVRRRLKDYQRDEVRLLKAFLKGIGVYGAEVKVEGFSGYLCELLIIHYGDFLSTLRAAARWKWGEYIDIEGHGEVKERRPLVVVDPVDPRRNVAHTVSKRSMATFIVAARAFLTRPSLKFFFPEEPRLSPSALRKIITERRSRPVLVYTKYPPGSAPDNVWGQLKRFVKLLRRRMEEKDNLVLQAEGWTDEREHVLVLLEVVGRYTARIHLREGPPVTDLEHSSRFLERHESDRFGPYVNEEGRLVAFYEVDQKSLLVEAMESVEEIVKGKSVGKDLLSSLEKGFQVVEGIEILRYYDVSPSFFSHFFLRKFPWEY